MTTLRRWLPALGWLLLIALIATVLVVGNAGDSLWAPAAMLPLVWIASPVFFPNRCSFARATDILADDPDAVVAYVRPASVLCIILRWRLRRLARRVHWVLITADPEAIEAVSEWGRGEALVPVVRSGDATRHNPKPRWIAQQIAAAEAADS